MRCKSSVTAATSGQLQHVTCDPHCNHKGDSHRIYTKGDEKGIETFQCRKSTGHRRQYVGNEGQKAVRCIRKTRHNDRSEVPLLSVVILNVNG